MFGSQWKNVTLGKKNALSLWAFRLESWNVSLCPFDLKRGLGDLETPHPPDPPGSIGWPTEQHSAAVCCSAGWSPGSSSNARQCLCVFSHALLWTCEEGRRIEKAVLRLWNLLYGKKKCLFIALFAAMSTLTLSTHHESAHLSMNEALQRNTLIRFHSHGSPSSSRPIPSDCSRSESFPLSWQQKNNSHWPQHLSTFQIILGPNLFGSFSDMNKSADLFLRQKVPADYSRQDVFCRF